MKYNNAYEGVRKIFRAEVMGLIAMVCAGLVAFLAAYVLKDGPTGPASGMAAAIVIFTLGASVLVIVSDYMNLIGLRTAAKDEENFRKGFIMAAVCIAISLLSGILASFNIGNEMMQSMFSLVSQVLSVAVSYYVLQGIMTLADKLENQEMKEKGRLVIYIYAGALLGSAVVSLISSLVRAEGVMAVVASVLSVIALIAGIVGYVCYIMYLHKAQKMLG
jgi:predicted membrane channel-forming protein YqfA (hemolysin III family)